MKKVSIILISAMKNLSFEINEDLLFKCKVFLLQDLRTSELTVLLIRALGQNLVNRKLQFLRICFNINCLCQ